MSKGLVVARTLDASFAEEPLVPKASRVPTATRDGLTATTLRTEASRAAVKRVRSPDRNWSVRASNSAVVPWRIKSRTSVVSEMAPGGSGEGGGGDGGGVGGGAGGVDGGGDGGGGDGAGTSSRPMVGELTESITI